MTDYEPYPTVTFAGTTTYADNTISSIRISSGRNDVTEQPQPGYANIDLWTDASDPLDVALSQSVSIAIDKGTAGTQEIFYGNISDIDITLDAYGSEGSIARYSITCIGPLAQLNRRTAGTANYGGGGGGGGGPQNLGTVVGGNGGSGVVIIRIPEARTATFSGGVTQSSTTSGGFKIYTVTATSTTSETVTFS